MRKSPFPPLFDRFRFLAEQREPGKTTQVSSVPIKEICLFALVLVYLFREQIWKLAHTFSVRLLRAIGFGECPWDSKSIYH